MKKFLLIEAPNGGWVVHKPTAELGLHPVLLSAHDDLDRALAWVRAYAARAQDQEQGDVL